MAFLIGTFAVTGAMAAQAAIAAASVAYQYSQQRKMRKQADKAAEARKGFELVIEGRSSPLPLVYGRALVGGVRVHHNTMSSFKYVTPNSSKNFLSGVPGTGSFTYEEAYYTGDTLYYEAVTAPGSAGSLLNTNVSGKKNEFLFFQQAMCIGPINAAYDTIINDTMYLDDPLLGSNLTDGATVDTSKARSAMRLDVNYGTGTSDAIYSVNNPTRINSTFPDVAYISAVFKVNRDDPVFSSVPSVQMLIEGRKVHTLTSGALSGSRVYSNNPVWCLLDYLMDPIVGKGLSLAKIDTASFEAAAAICNTVVLTGAQVGGKIWKPTDGSRNVSTRDIPLYECNLILDTSNQIRNNVETILGTMGDARLVWSQNKYKLILQVPSSNAAISLAGDLTDEDLVIDDSIDITWPSSSERLNQATVRFHNESMDFNEDSVSWPPKASGTFLRGVGSNVYPDGSSYEDKTDEKFKILNEYGVWSGTGLSCSLSWKFAVLTTGTHTLKWSCDDAASITVTGTGVSVSQSGIYNNLYTATFTATKDTIITVAVSVSSSAGRKAFGGTVLDSASMLAWTSKSPAYTSFITVIQTSTVYDAMLAEDNDVLLETETFADGISDYYHALAKAEETVRISRTAFVIKFQYLIKSRYFEPGDIIRLNSETLNLTDLYIRINDVRLKDGAVCEVTGTRFDYTQLAWNVADNEYLLPKNPYSFRLPAPEWVTHSPIVGTLGNSAGSVSWAAVANGNITGYIIYVHKAYELDANGNPLFIEVGRATTSPFELPSLSCVSGSVGVRAMTGNSISEMTVSASVVFSSRTLRLNAGAPGFIKDKFDVFAPTTITLTPTLTGYKEPQYRWYVDNVLLLSAVTPFPPIDTKTIVIDPFATGGSKTYKVTVEELAYAATDDTLLSSSVSLFSLEDGKSNPDMFLTNSAHVFSANASGVISDYSGGTTVAQIIQGGVNKTEDWVFTRTNSADITSTINGNASGVASISGATSITIAITSVGNSTDSGYVDIIATKGADTITRRFSFTKTKSGSIGYSTFIGTVYKEAATIPSTPTGGSYNFSTGIFIAPSTWVSPIPTIGLERIWASSFTFISNDPTTTVSAGTWSTPVLAAQPPTQSVQIFIYRRNATEPTLPSASTTYTFATNALTGLNNGWTTTVPAGSDPTWVSIATAANYTATDTIAAAEWSTPINIGSTGATGYSTASVFLFQRAATNVSPALPAVSLTFTFATGLLSGGSLNGWSQTLPTTGAPYIFMTSATASSNNPTDTIASGEWAAGALLTTDGAPGASGQQAATVSIYQWATTEPTLLPVGDCTYTWSTVTLTMSGTPNSWSNYVPANPGTPGIKLWVAYKKIVASALDATTTVTWTTDYTVVYVGANGLDGADGTGSPGIHAAIPTVYAWGLSAPSIAGSGTYTWATGAISFIPAGWTAEPTGGVAGQTLWGASVSIIDNATVTTTNVDWTTASITSRGYKGEDGTGTTPGPPGAQGLSAKRAYTISTAASLGAGSVVTTGPSSVPPTNSVFGSGLSWSPNTLEPTAGTNEKLYQSDGIYSPTTNQITWDRPYISSLKVGNLSAIAVNTGGLTVDNFLTLGSSGAIKSGTFSSYAWPTPDGIGGLFISKDGILVGNKTTLQRFEITAAGDLYFPKFSIVNGDAIFSGSLLAATGSFYGQLKVGSSPEIFLNSMTGSGAVINQDGTFAIGNATNNIVFNSLAGQIYINGPVVATSNLQAQAVNVVLTANGTGSSISVNITVPAGETWTIVGFGDQDAQSLSGHAGAGSLVLLGRTRTSEYTEGVDGADNPVTSRSSIIVSATSTRTAGTHAITLTGNSSVFKTLIVMVQKR